MTRIVGDCREVLATLPKGSVQMCVTSPPYWGLRDYGTATWEGGRKNCDHRKVSDVVAAVATSTLGGGKKTTGHIQEGFKATCRKCGARRIDQQLGLEATPEEFIANLVGVFRLVREVLADDGVLFINMGDSYAGAAGAGWRSDPRESTSLEGGRATVLASNRNGTPRSPGLKPKDLCGIPWRLAFALQAAGWYLRSDIIWHKPNPMPESVRDRPTRSHEYLFLLSKRATYFYDCEAVKEPATSPPKAFRSKRYVNQGYAPDNASHAGQVLGIGQYDASQRNRRTVWTIATAPFKGAHFATYPPKLVEPCILAGSRPGDVVLDPFAGSGTTGLVAESLGRKFIGIELNGAYSLLAREAA